MKSKKLIPLLSMLILTAGSTLSLVPMNPAAGQQQNTDTGDEDETRKRGDNNHRNGEKNREQKGLDVSTWEDWAQQSETFTIEIPADLKALHKDPSHKKENKLVYSFSGFIIKNKKGHRLDPFKKNTKKEKTDPPPLILKKLSALYQTEPTEKAFKKSLAFYFEKSRKRLKKIWEKEKTRKRIKSVLKDKRHEERYLLFGIKQSERKWTLIAKTHDVKKKETKLDTYGFRKVGGEWFLDTEKAKQKSFKNLRIFIFYFDKFHKPKNWYKMFKGDPFN